MYHKWKSWCMVTEIWSVTNRIFCHFGQLLPFYPKNPKNQNFEKMKKRPGDMIILHKSVFSIWKSLQVLQKARIKSITRAIYTYLIFSYTYTLLFCWKMSCCDSCFSQEIRPQTTAQLYIFWNYSSLKIGFNMINKRHAHWL